MAERLMSPQDFATGAPERIMGTEAEDQSPTLNINKLLSKENFQKIDIKSFIADEPKQSRWLTNGQRIYKDQGFLESCTAEQLGPERALAGTIAAIKVVKKLADANGEEGELYRRSATVNSEGHIETAGFHMNHITTKEAIDRLASDEDGVSGGLLAHAATRMYTWGGMVTADGFKFSQKAHAFPGDHPFFKVKGEDIGGFFRVEDYSGEFSSPWGTFMSMATTSVLLRVVEHPNEVDLNKRLSKLELKDPYKAIHVVSADKTFKETLPLADGRTMTAIEIQSELADTAAEFGKRFTLPKDEQYAVEQWQQICQDLQKIADTDDMKSIATRVGFVSKKLWLEKKNIGTLTADNPKAIYFDMRWDRLYPEEGGVLILPKKTGLTIATDADVDALVESPPQNTRAALRAKHIEKPPFPISNVLWKRIQSKKHDYISFHPYQTE